MLLTSIQHNGRWSDQDTKKFGLLLNFYQTIYGFCHSEPSIYGK